MTTVALSPLFNGWQGFDTSGLPLSGGLLYTYVAGSTTPLATYTTSAGSVANTNPIILGPDGRPPQEIWLIVSDSYKFQLNDVNDSPIFTYDNIGPDGSLNYSAGSTKVGFIQAGTGAVARTAQAKMREVLSITDFGGSPSNTAALNSAAIAAAITQAKAAGTAGTQTIYFPAGVYLYDTDPAITSTGGLCFIGESYSSAATSGTVLRYTGTGSTGLSMVGNFFSVENIAFQYSSGSFTGSLVKVAGAGFSARNSSFAGFGSSTGLYDLNIDASTSFIVDHCWFDNAQYGILGQAVSGASFCNGGQISTCTFGNGITVADIRNPGQGWDIAGVVFEELANLKGKAILMDAGVSARGIAMHGCWMGDATDASAWSWIEFRGQGLSITGTYFNGTGTNDPIGVQIKAASQGVSITGNRFVNFLNGVDVGTNLLSDSVIFGNYYSGTSAFITGTPLGNCLFQDAGASVALDVWGGGVVQLRILNDGTIGTAYSFNTSQGGTAFSGVLAPPADGGGAQGVCHLYAGNGAPNNGNGANGDFYFRGDGTQAGNTVIYHKQSGAWVALIST